MSNLHTPANEVRVGIMFLTGLILLVLLILSLTNMGHERDTYTFYIRFKRAEGILLGAQVRVSGVTEGRVTSVGLDPTTNSAILTVKVDKNVKLYTDYTYSIDIGGLVGERYVEITPTHKLGNIVYANQIVDGVSPPEMTDLFAATNTLLAKLTTTADNLNKIVGDTGTQQSLKRAIVNLQEAAGSSALFMEQMRGLLRRNQSHVDAVVDNLQRTTASTAQLAGGMDTFFRNNQTQLQTLVAGMSKAASNSAEFVDALNGFMAKNQGSLATAITNLQETTASSAEFSRGLNTFLQHNQADLQASITNLKTTTAATAEMAADLDTLLKGGQGDLTTMIANLKNATASSAEFTAGLNGMMKENRTVLAAAVTDLRATTKSSADFAAKLNTLLQQNQADLSAAIANLKTTTATSADLASSLNMMVQHNTGSIDTIVANLQSVSSGLRTVSDTLTPQLTNNKLLPNLEAASSNVEKLTAKLNNIATTVDTLLNDKELAGTIRNSEESLQRAAATLDTIVVQARDALAGLPKMASNFQQVSEDMRVASASVKSAGSDLPLITHPFRDVAPEAAQNVLDISRSLRNTSQEISGAAQQLSRFGTFFETIKVEPEARIMALSRGSQSTRSDMDVDVRMPNAMLRLGMANIDQGNQWNAQFGNQFSQKFWLRYGIVQSRFGAGIDYNSSRDLRLSAEIFDPDTPRANVTLDQRLRMIGQPWWVSVGWYDLFSANHTFGAGVVYRP